MALIKRIFKIAAFAFVFLFIITFLFVAFSSSRHPHSGQGYQDGRIKSHMAGLRVATEIYFDLNGKAYTTYNIRPTPCSDRSLNGTIFADKPSAVSFYIDEIIKRKSTPICAAEIIGNETRYAVSAPLGHDNYSWCIDSSGTSHTIAGDIKEAKCPPRVIEKIIDRIVNFFNGLF